MKIESKHIEFKKTAGFIGKKPVIYIYTKGGLHAFFVENEDGKIESIAAAAHLGIAKWMAEQKNKDIEWKDDFLHKSEDYNKDNFTPSFFEAIRKTIFSLSQLEKSEIRSPYYYFYDVVDETVDILSKDEIKQNISKLNKYTIVRNVGLDEPVYLLEDHPDFKE